MPSRGQRRAYQIVRADIGHILSARIIPALARWAARSGGYCILPEKIEDRLELQKQNFLSSLLPVSTEQDASVPDSQKISPEDVMAALSDTGTELQDTDSLRPRSPGKSDMYLTEVSGLPKARRARLPAWISREVIAAPPGNYRQ